MLFVALLGSLASLAAAQSFSETIAGTWIMEDLYTMHVSGGGVERIESHPIGAFQFPVEFRRDGTGSQDGRGFVWTHNRDEIQWRFDDGTTVSLLVRFLTLDYFLVVARVLGQPEAGAVMSGLRRLQ